MSDDPTRREREEKAALELIKAKQGLAGKSKPAAERWWVLGQSPERLALEGVLVFGIAFLVGRGLAVLYSVFANA